eukprot:TRINITY_DN57557_c0_g1_i1.p1 TRINITY_DN57557_c0_g1~~TRINITY_DN57557_c0_g1_i1.p1  ORF type:complete len:644 (-),score=111.96 TRINITY_DN57557_c0_g1_i1:117-1940(-)
MLREVAEKRLQTIREFTEFGSGFKIAMRDLEIRGAGNLLGAEQHGHMESVGYDMYCRLLEEEVQQLKGEAPKQEVLETTVDLNISAYIPDFYIKNQEQRMELYKKIANVRMQEEYFDIQEEMEDRFGDLPKSVQTLLEIVLLKSEARNLGISSIVQKRGNILFQFRTDAKTDPLKLTQLISQGRGKYLFTAGAAPYLTLKLNKEKEAKVLEEIKFVLNAIKGQSFKERVCIIITLGISQRMKCKVFWNYLNQRMKERGIKMKKKGLLCLLIAGAMALCACGSDNASNSDNASGSDFSDEAVMKIDGREIMKSEYMVYLYTTTKSFTSVGGDDIWTTDFDGQTADELVEERTVKTLQTVIAAKKYAEENNIALTDDQKTEVTTASEQFASSVPAEDIAKMGIDAKSLAPFMEGSYIYSLVYQALVSECEVDEAEKANYYEENKDQIKEELITVDMDTIVLDNLDKANEVAEKAKNGEDFQSLFQEYDVDENAKQQEDGSKMTVYKTQLLSSFGLTEIPEVGVITGPIDMDGTYFVLRVSNITTPDESEVKVAAEKTFTTQKQTEYSDARFEEMIASQSVEYMDEAYKNLEKFHQTVQVVFQEEFFHQK